MENGTLIIKQQYNMKSTIENKNDKEKVWEDGIYTHEDCQVCESGKIDFGDYLCYNCKGYGSVMTTVKEGKWIYK
jgi:hypothetical protein